MKKTDFTQLNDIKKAISFLQDNIKIFTEQKELTPERKLIFDQNFKALLLIEEMYSNYLFLSEASLDVIFKISASVKLMFVTPYIKNALGYEFN